MGTVVTSLRTYRRAASWAAFDPYMAVTTLVLIGFGLVAIWSAEGAGPLRLDSLAVRQFIYALVGLPLLLGLAWVDYRYIKSLAWPIYGLTLALLSLVMLFGTNIGGSVRWIELGPITVQPSEPAKLGVIIALAAFMANRGEEMAQLKNFVLSGLLVGLPALLVYQQPDLGTAGVLAAIWLAMVLFSPARLLYVAGVLLASPFAALFAWKYVLHDYMRERLLISFEPERDYFGAGFNIIQAQITIGTGGWHGNGLAGSMQSQLDLLRVRTTDFIFAHAMGMFGFIGGVALIVTYLLLLWRTSHVVTVAPDLFGRLLAVGVTVMIFFQAFVNMGMNVGIMPVTGLPLPFISLGGSSLWTLLASLGLLQSVLVHRRRIGFKPV
jgi:rod shape determining protein RodA